MDWDLEDLASSSISLKIYWLDSGLLQHVWALWTAYKAGIHSTSKVVLVYNIHSYTQSLVHTMQLLTVSLGLVNVHVPVEGFKGLKPLKPFAYPYPYPSKPLPSLRGKGFDG